jgi:predicted nucleotidyltransferase
MAEQSYPTEFERVIQALNETGVRYVIVGGVAVVIHGIDRLTADLDVVIDLDPIACKTVMSKLVDIGYRPRPPVEAVEFADEAKRKEWIRDKSMRVFSLWDPSSQLPVLDVFVEYPLDFGQLLQESISTDLGIVTAPIASIKHLIEMKSDTGREKDQQDIARLNERIKGQ